MLKVLLASIAALLFSACANSTSTPMHMHKMFQSVNENQAVLVQQGKEKRYCTRCGMDLVKFYKTSHAAEGEDGHKYQYCSIHCLEDHLQEGVTLKNPQVIDVSSLKFIDATKAYYVVGSKVHGTMSRVSKYAFANENDAKAFQAKHGGEIMDFDHALKKAKEDWIRN